MDRQHAHMVTTSGFPLGVLIPDRTTLREHAMHGRELSPGMLRVSTVFLDVASTGQVVRVAPKAAFLPLAGGLRLADDFAFNEASGNWDCPSDAATLSIPEFLGDHGHRATRALLRYDNGYLVVFLD